MQFTRRKALALPLGLAATANLVSRPAHAQAGPIKVGVPIALSGPAALYGEPALKGAHMFVQELNAAGGVLGRKIELVVRDSKATPDEAVRVSREMILKATFRRPTRGDLDLSTLPGAMPALSSLKILSYDEDAWTDKRKETLERIKDTIQESR